MDDTQGSFGVLSPVEAGRLLDQWKAGDLTREETVQLCAWLRQVAKEAQGHDWCKYQAAKVLLRWCMGEPSPL